MTGRNRQPERVREAKMDDGECRRDGRGGKGNEAKTPRSAQQNKKSMEDLGKEKVNRKEQSKFQLRAAARSRNALNQRFVREGRRSRNRKPKSRMSLSEARPRGGMAGQDPGTRWQKFSDQIPTENIGCGWPKAMCNLKTATVFGRRPDLSSERANGKETANGGEQPRTIPDASAEASIGRSEVTNGRLESEPREGDERWTEVRGTKVERRRR
ncbi:hypothetical protein DFH06DRAFT_1140341 [Mycena polygramma]|nr:hypothetical protein DFH06DRAFT_1140341 [Mycena polygramma]